MSALKMEDRKMEDQIWSTLAYLMGCVGGNPPNFSLHVNVFL